MVKRIQITSREVIGQLEWRPEQKEGADVNPPVHSADPGIFEIIGGIAQAFGLAEQIQRIIPSDRIASRRRHARIDKKVQDFKDALDDARGALRLIRTTIAGHTAELPEDAIGINVPAEEVSLYRRGLAQLHDAIKRMTDAAYELEALTDKVPQERERFYRVSQAGGPVLNSIRDVLRADRTESPASAPSSRLELLLDEIDRYLAVCSKMLDERNRWLQQ
jgi:hypothetical protein